MRHRLFVNVAQVAKRYSFFAALPSDLQHFPTPLRVSPEEVVPVKPIQFAGAEQFTPCSILRSKFLPQSNQRPMTDISPLQIKADLEAMESVYWRNFNVNDEYHFGKALALNDIAKLKLHELKIDAAEHYLQQAMTIIHNATPHLSNADLCFKGYLEINLAAILQARKQYQEGHDLLTSAFKNILNYQGYHTEIEAIYFQIAMSFTTLGQPDRTIEILNYMLKKAKLSFTNSPQRQCWIMSATATIHKLQAEFAAAKILYESCLTVCVDNENKITDQINLAHLAMLMGNTDLSLDLLTQVQRVLQTWPDTQHPLVKLTAQLKQCCETLCSKSTQDDNGHSHRSLNLTR